MAEIGSNFSKIIEMRGIKKSDVAKATGIPYSCFTDWTHGRYIPKLDKIHKIAEYLNVSSAILIDDSLDIDEIPNPSCADDYVEFLDLYARLNDNDKGLLVEIARNMLDRELLFNKYRGIIDSPTS